MRDADKTPERRAPAESGFVPAVSHRLRQLLATLPTHFPCRYACLIHPRRRGGEQGFGVITLAGESLPLSVDMLASLRRVPTLFEGRAPVVLGPAADRDSVILSEDGEWAVPLPVPRFLMRLLSVADSDEEAPPPQATDQIVAPFADGPQITLFCATRPAGWPA